jgi:hypothetical protein|tara:strand:- start:50 stop:241 length:192 start_codon:yes stop_codon:yes gene_type:complete
MTDRNAPATMTFEEWRVEFNELATDMGDFATLNSGIASTAPTDVVETLNALDAKTLTMAIALG